MSNEMEGSTVKSLLREISLNLSTLAISGTVVGRCMDEACPGGQVSMTFADYRGDIFPQEEGPIFVCPTCRERLRVTKLAVKAVQLDKRDDSDHWRSLNRYPKDSSGS